MKTEPWIEALEARIAPAVIIVNTLADTTGVIGKTSLRDALALADNHPGADTIVFKLPAAPAPGANIIKLNGTELTSGGNVTIKGPGAGKLIIDGDNASRIFDFNDNASSADSPVSISGLSILHGNGAGASSAGNGGGIYSSESLTLKNVVVSGNTTAPGDSGGGVYVLGSSTVGTKVSISNSLVTGNSADSFAGGLWLANLHSLAISKTVVSGNTATLGTAGGIYASLSATGTGMAITGCVISGNSAYGGGGLLVRDYNPAPASKITISGTMITGNTATGKNLASGGGGLYIGKGSNAVITGSSIENNTAVYFGGGIFTSNNFASLTISGSTISGNQTTKTNATYQGGGGLFIKGAASATPQQVKITGSHIADNQSASNGGGLLAQNGLALTVSNSTFSGNGAVDGGGGLATFGTGTNKQVDLIVTGGSFSGNTCSSKSDGSGGGLFANGDGAFSITSSKVTGNVVAYSGGGIDAKSTAGLVSVTKVTASGNTAVFGGGLSLFATQGFQVSGGSITGNEAFSGGGISALTKGTISGTTITGNAAISQGGGVNLIGSETVTLQAAKVTGNTAPTGPNTYTKLGNISGFAAALPNAGSGTFVVNTTADSTDAPGSGTVSLRDALALADADPATVDTIGFALPANQLVDGAFTIALTSGLASKGNVNIVGPGAGKLIIDGDGKYQILNINDGSNTTDSPVTISGLSLINGNANGTGSVQNGGAIYSAESLTLKKCTISGNSAKGAGGGVYALSQDTATTAVTVIGCLVSGNTAHGNGSASDDGGGLFVRTNKTVLISGSTITGNIDQGYNGGLFAKIASSSGGSSLTISNDLIAGNTAAYGGGGLAVQDDNTTLTAKGAPVSKITISSSTISGNSVTGTNAAKDNTGGGIYCYNGNVVLSKVTISNNTAVGGGGGIEATAATSLTITGGSIDGNNVTKGTGGGIDLHTGSTPLTVKGALVTGNHASGNGGGIYLKTSGTVQITGSTISANGTGVAGGGIASKGTGALNITGGFISDNLASTDAGGGIYVFQGTDVKIQSAKITGNITTVGEGGGAYLNTTGIINVISSIISGNQAADKGGGVNLGGNAVLTLKGDTFAGNTSGKVGGGMLIGPGLTGTIIGTKITGNIALTDGGGIYDDALGKVTLGAGEAALITGNSAPTDPNQHGI